MSVLNLAQGPFLQVRGILRRNMYPVVGHEVSFVAIVVVPIVIALFASVLELELFRRVYASEI
jgi:hypothetical protein